MPKNLNMLFWSQAERDAGFRALDSNPEIVRWRTAMPGDRPRPLQPGPELNLGLDLDAYMASQNSAAVLVLHKSRLRLERYGLGMDGSQRWTSFSVAKSITSTLVGAAMVDGYIDGLEDAVSTYIPDLRGSAYDDVNLRQLLTMTSGVAWNEDYEDRDSDVARFNSHRPDAGMDMLVSYMRRLPRACAPGTHWNYSTGETNLIGILVSQAVGRPLTEYLEEKIWSRIGMEYPATWLLNRTGNEISGCCIQASPRDFARFGRFILEGAAVDGRSVVPDGWLEQATRKQTGIDMPGRGYGYQWWTYDDGSFTARGIFGQGVFVDPARELVIATHSSWSSARDPRQLPEREDFYRAVQEAVDAEPVA